MRETIMRYRLLEPGQSVLVGVSGGADSVALLHLLTRLAEEWRLRIEVAHLHHGFRGAESDSEAEYVRALCEAWRVPCHVLRCDAPALMRQRHLSAQEAARELRHAFLRETAQRISADRIALAHTQTDRIETVLLQILRGTGTQGLIGFPPMNLPLIRPLYAIRREETQDYCRQLQLEPREDSSNSKLDYRRNRVRLELLPCASPKSRRRKMSCSPLSRFPR
jgi:tRNA(Ile)-lysidine synthase